MMKNNKKTKNSVVIRCHVHLRYLKSIVTNNILSTFFLHTDALPKL